VTLTVRDSRRLTGPNILWDHPGAVLDLDRDPAFDPQPAIDAWRGQVRRMLDAVGWQAQQVTSRVLPDGVSLAISAPIDALYAATEITEWAWRSTREMLAGEVEPELEQDADKLRELIAAEVNPALLALRDAARAHGVSFLSDDDFASVGLGAGSRCWPVDALPDEVDWSEIYDIPVALVTGTNGKTTTVRLLAAMVSAAGKLPGLSSTDWLKVGDDVLDTGDYSGPGGARTILRDRRVEVAILETARGGIQRRGLAVGRADVALVTNVAEDHLGDFGVHDLRMLAQTKMVVQRAAQQLVLNADDALLVELAAGLDLPIDWFSQQDLVDGQLTRAGQAIAHVDQAPFTLGGAALHNVANALGAIGVAHCLGLPVEAMRVGLAAFGSSHAENPGRLNQFQLGGARVLVDFAHNPHGVEALLRTAAALPAERRLILIGQAGDRDDEAIRHLARQTWAAQPDRVIVKDLPQYLRGREPGEVPRILTDELVACGAEASAIGLAEGDLDAVRQALAWCRSGDLLLLIAHEERDQVLALIGGLEDANWQPGDALPES